MLEMNVKEVRNNLRLILDKVEQGEEVVITRRGRRVARLSSLENAPTPLKSLNEFRKSIHVKGSPLSQTVIDQRGKERY